MKSAGPCRQNVIDGQGRGERNLSIWLVGWNARTCVVATPDGKQLSWPGGLPQRCAVVPIDWRYIVRIANVDPFGAPDLLHLAAKALMRIPQLKRDHYWPVWYMNRDGWGLLKDLGADPDLRLLHGLPVRIIEALRSDEARVALPGPG